jgi:hypothetical protein
VAEAELSQQDPPRRGSVNTVEQRRHPAGADHVQLIDAVRPRGHPGNDTGQLARRIHRARSDLRGRKPHPLEQSDEPSLLGQRPHRHQTSTRHRLCSSNRAASTDHPCEDLTESAPGNADHRVLDQPDHPSSEGTFPIHTPLTDAIRPRIQAKSFPEDHHWKEAWRSCHCFGWPAAPAGAPAPPAPRWTHATAAPERLAPRATARPTQTQRKIITPHSQLITPDTPKIKLPT